MTQIRRNDPCLCGSGKKYKKCCREVDETAARARMIAAHDDERQRGVELRQLEARRAAATLAQPAAASLGWEIVEDDLDEVSNGVLDLIREKRFPEALLACEYLLREYPEVHDGFARSGLVHDAMGNHSLAAAFWEKAVDFVEDPVRRDDYDPEALDYYREHRDAARARAARTAEAEPTPAADPERAP